MEEQYAYEAKSPDPPAFHRRILENDISCGVPIIINKSNYDFRNPSEVERICYHNKDKVIAASKEKAALHADAALTAAALLADAELTAAFDVNLNSLESF